MEWMEKRRNWLILAIAVIIAVYGAYSMFSKASGKGEGKVAEIKIEGVISHSSGGSSLFSDSKTTPEDIQELVDKAKKDDVEGYLFKLNSPGGAAVASKDMAQVIKRIDEPTTCLMQEVAASGAYWTAIECDQIFADQLSITGSIGVSSAYLQYSSLLEEYGVDYINLTAGKYKDIRSPYKDLKEEEREILQKQLDRVHELFKKQIAESRNLSMEKMDKYATGQTFLGQRAKKIGLVDRLGGEKEAIKQLENRTGLELETKEYEKDSDFNILSLLPVKVGYGIGKAMIEAEQDVNGIETRFLQ